MPATGDLQHVKVIAPVGECFSDDFLTGLTSPKVSFLFKKGSVAVLYSQETIPWLHIDNVFTVGAHLGPLRFRVEEFRCRQGRRGRHNGSGNEMVGLHLRRKTGETWIRC